MSLARQICSFKLPALVISVSTHSRQRCRLHRFSHESGGCHTNDVFATKSALDLSFTDSFINHNSKLALNLAAGNINYMHVKYENVRPQNEGMKNPSH